LCRIADAAQINYSGVFIRTSAGCCRRVFCASVLIVSGSATGGMDRRRLIGRTGTGYPRVREVPYAVAATSSAISAAAATSRAPADWRPMASPANAVMAAVITTMSQARSNPATPVAA
jgi:hypothetical protein